MSRRSKAAEQGTAGDVELHYTITPKLVSSLSYARWVAGRASVLGLSFYGLRSLQTEMMHLRIAEMTVACTFNVTMKEVERVVAGDLLPPRRQAAMETIRLATALSEAVRLATNGSKATDAETCWSYFEFAKAQPMGWAHFVGLPRDSLIDHRRKKTKPPPELVQLYEWIDRDELVSDDPILRAATLFFGLRDFDEARPGRIARMAVVDHELQARLDPRGFLALRNRKLGGMALRPTAPGFGHAQTTGDLTRYFEFFASAVGDGMSEIARDLEGRQETEQRRPWMTVRPPDQLDRQIFDAVQRLGSATIQQLLGAIHDPPPLRTVQRRLKRLCDKGLLAKHGSRRDAFYRLPESDP